MLQQQKINIFLNVISFFIFKVKRTILKGINNKNACLYK